MNYWSFNITCIRISGLLILLVSLFECFIQVILTRLDKFKYKEVTNLNTRNSTITFCNEIYNMLHPVVLKLPSKVHLPVWFVLTLQRAPLPKTWDAFEQQKKVHKENTDNLLGRKGFPKLREENVEKGHKGGLGWVEKGRKTFLTFEEQK